MRIISLLLLFVNSWIYGQIAPSAVPDLEELASDWMDVPTLRNFPSVTNFAGGLQTTQNLTGFQNLTFPPYAQGGFKPFSWKEGLNSPALSEGQKENGECALLVNGKPVTAATSRWLPYEVQRKTSINGVEMQSTIRLPFEQKGVLQRLILHNNSYESRSLVISMNCYGRVRYYSKEQWQTWGNIRPADSNFMILPTGDRKASDLKAFFVQDKTSRAVTGFLFVNKPDEISVTGEKGEAKWNIVLAPGKRAVIEWVCAIGDDVGAASSLTNTWASNFKVQFDAAKMKWEKRWRAYFIPGNKLFSGHFPTLQTDDPKIRRVYYQSALVPLLLCRTSLPLSRRCFVTAGPQWANTLVYFWDTEMWANTWAMLEPETMKEQLAKWLSMDIHRCYAVDCQSGGGAGPWYAANDWSVFRCVEAYLGVTGDSSFLRQDIGNKTVLERLDGIATFYETRPLMKGSPLANYGGPENLLECSPSYIEGVPSLNAANVYMLRKTAEYYERSGNSGRAEELRSKAQKLLPSVMSLYATGQGVWNALDTAGNKVPIRHCYDYITIGQALEKDLSPQIKAEMNHFVHAELLTRTWMRAMSLRDPAAAKSDRPDHGPMGSYDAWPPMTMDVMCRFGDFGKAVAFLRATEAIAHQGTWSQAHEFVGPDSRGFDPIVRVASRGGQDANEGCGAAFAEVIIRSFFGFRPDLSANHPVLLSPDVPRGFSGTLKHVSWRNQLYTIVSDAKGVHFSGNVVGQPIKRDPVSREYHASVKEYHVSVKEYHVSVKEYHVSVKEYHVSVNGDDANDGSAARPFETIMAAANMAMPGDVITVHAGTYREQITPPRGGNSDQERIVYQAAKGEKVEIKGSEIIRGWERAGNDTWVVKIPNRFFGKFNPYNDLIRGDWFYPTPKERKYHTGAVYLNGDWLMEAANQEEVMKTADAKNPLWWATVDSSITTIWAQFKNTDPNKETVEINARQTIFYPDKPFINFITVRGFILQHAATNWAPPTAEQMGLIGTHWSKGWVIEDNTIQYSKCSGIALGKYGDKWDNNNTESAEGYVGTINRALAFGWNKGTIGGHLVQNNRIAYCEQTGIVGSMGCSFSTIKGNVIHDIHIRRLFSGAEMAGIKFHGGVDVQIMNNHIYRANMGIWLDWMAQGAQIKNNLFHDNSLDIFLEVQHGPILVSNNISLSKVSLLMNSSGIAFVHNLFGGTMNVVAYDSRLTPYHKPHSTYVAALHDNPGGDIQFINNLFVNGGDASQYSRALLPVIFSGNVYTKGSVRAIGNKDQKRFGEMDKNAKGKMEKYKEQDAVEGNAVVKDEFDASAGLLKQDNSMYLEIAFDKSWVLGRKRKLVTTMSLGTAVVPNLPFENTDGSLVRIDMDYFGKKRDIVNPSPGPFEIVNSGKQRIKVW